MTDNTQPEAIRIADEFNLCLKLDSIPSIIDIEKAEAELRRQHTHIAELESELEAIGAGGVQALSAAPAVPTSVKGAMWFTKKPVTIQAIQWTGENLREVITFTDGPPDTRSHHAGMAWDAYRDLVARDGLKIYTLEGKMLASPGDWIIRGVKGELYPCKDEIFRLTYEPVGEVVSASCDHATVRWLHQTSSVGGGDPRNSRAWPKVSGVSRDEGHSRALLVFFAAEPTDDEMRAVHDTLAASTTPTSPAEQQAQQGAVYAAFPERRRVFLCTKCGGRECESGSIHQTHPPCKCGYLGFAENLDFTEDQMRDFADRTHAQRMEQAAPKAAPGEPTDSDGFGSAEHWKEKAQYWAGVAHRLRGEALRGEPVDGIVHPPAPQQEAQEPSHRETVDVVGVRSNGEHVNLGKIAMPPRMKAREIAIEQFGSFKDDDGSDAEMCDGR